MNTNSDYFYSIEHSVSAEFTDKGSRFIAYVLPIKNKEEFKTHLSLLKAEHPKAVHHCFAYRINQLNFRSSDDGEPSGTAGKPILNQIDSKKLQHVLVIVVRYFGGVLLGVPGLINAYKTATQLALNNAAVVKKEILSNYLIEIDFNSLGEIMTFIKRHQIEIVNKKIELFCEIEVAISNNQKKLLMDFGKTKSNIVINKVTI